MLDLCLAVACGLAIGMIFKLAGRRGLDRLSLLTVNYFTALLLALALLYARGDDGSASLNPDAGLLILGLVEGALFIGTFFILALATEIAGMSLAIGVMRISVVIPFLASWVLWEEVPTPAQGLGLGLGGLAFFLLAQREAPASRPRGPLSPVPPAAAPLARGMVSVVLALLFLAGGATDLGLKVFDEIFAVQHSRSLFLSMVFGVAFMIGLAVMLFRAGGGHVSLPAAVAVWGIALGLVNYGSAAFFLRAVRQLSGPFVFPANNIALVVGAALLGVLVWGERLSIQNGVGLGLAGLALWLLTH